MNFKDFVKLVATKTGFTQKDVKEVLDASFDVMGDAMQEGSFVNVPGFGKFVAKAKPAREGRNPATGEQIMIAAKNMPKFTAAKALKEKVNA